MFTQVRTVARTIPTLFSVQRERRNTARTGAAEPAATLVRHSVQSVALDGQFREGAGWGSGDDELHWSMVAESARKRTLLRC